MFSLILVQDKSLVSIGSLILSAREIVQLPSSYLENVKINGKEHKRHNEPFTQRVLKGLYASSRAGDQG